MPPNLVKIARLKEFFFPAKRHKKRKKAKKAILEKAANIVKIAKIPYIFEAYLINSFSFSEVNFSHLTPQVRLLFVESKET